MRHGLIGLGLMLGLFFSGPQKAFCQDIPEKKLTLDLAGLLNHMTLIDQKYSAANYSGSIPGIYFRVGYQSARLEQALETFYFWGNLKTARTTESNLRTSQLNINYFSLFRVLSSDNRIFHFSLGPGVEFLYNQRYFNGFINTPHSFETLISLGLTGKFSYQFGQGTDCFRLTDQFTVPLLFYYVQPGFSGLEEIGEGKSKQGQFVFLPDTFRLMNMISIEKPVSPVMGISIFYNWDFYQIQSSRPVKNNSQEFGLSFRYRI